MRPKRRGMANPDCNQSRLATIHMYTDDPVAIVVGAQRAMRLLQAWHTVTNSVNLTMAGPEKRQIGAHVEWIRVIICAAICVVAVPRGKLLRAREAIVRTLEEKITFGEYRALVGLLEHLKFVAQLPNDLNDALYTPHGREGESKDGPGAVIRPSRLMRDKLRGWLSVILDCVGALSTIALATDAIHVLRSAHAAYLATSDAAGDGRGEPGMGGYIHGLYWRMPLPPPLLALMHITAWETLAAAITILVAHRLAGSEATIAQRSDAALTPPVRFDPAQIQVGGRTDADPRAREGDPVWGSFRAPHRAACEWRGERPR